MHIHLIILYAFCFASIKIKTRKFRDSEIFAVSYLYRYTEMFEEIRETLKKCLKNRYVDLSGWTFFCYPTNSSNPGDNISFKFYIFLVKWD